MAVERHADAVWEGGLADGHGRVSGGSEAITDLAVTWASRVEAPAGRTSPEELIAAAHASCFSMAFSAELAKLGAKPERVAVRAEVTLDRSDAGYGITGIHLEVTGRAGDVTEATFDEAAQAAAKGCPVSKALSAVPITVAARLEAAVS